MNKNDDINQMSFMKKATIFFKCHQVFYYDDRYQKYRIATINFDSFFDSHLEEDIEFVTIDVNIDDYTGMKILFYSIEECCIYQGNSYINGDGGISLTNLSDLIEEQEFQGWRFIPNYKKMREFENKELPFKKFTNHFFLNSESLIPPKPKHQILYMVLGAESKTIKIGRTINWNNREDLYKGGGINTKDDNYFKSNEPLRLMKYSYIEGSKQKLYASEQILIDGFNQISNKYTIIDKFDSGREWYFLNKDDQLEWVIKYFDKLTRKLNEQLNELSNDLSKNEIMDKLYQKGR